VIPLHKKGDAELIKQMNTRLILSNIRKHQPITRAAVSRIVGVSRATVSSIVDDLIRKKLISEQGYGDSTKEGGRRGIHLVFNPISSYGIGVDVGGTKILIVLTDLDGNVVHKEEHATLFEPESIINMIKDFIKGSPVNEEDISAMGVGIPGILDSENGVVVDAPALRWENLHIRNIMRKSFAFPIFINNDVKCALFGELHYGAGKSCKSLAFIAIGTGVGSAIYVNGALLEGAHFSAGEIGYMTDRKDVEEGRFNVAGEFGQFEKRTSGSALNREGKTAYDWFSEYDEGKEESITVIDNYLLDLAIGISNVVCVVNPEKIILGGGVSRSLGPHMKKIEGWVKKLTPIPVTIERSQLGSDTGAIGAVAYAFMQVEHYEGE
jgi:glucokinase